MEPIVIKLTVPLTHGAETITELRTQLEESAQRAAFAQKEHERLREAQKAHECGCGALYLQQGARILPRQVGGLQERTLRGGTEAAPLIAAFGAAVEALPPLAEQEALFKTLKARLIDRLAGRPVVFHLPADGVPYIVHLSVPGLKSETLLHFLSERDIFVSSGSACAKGAKSPVLQAMGLPAAEIDSALRISLCHHNTEADIDRLAEALTVAIETLARRR